MKEQRLIEKLKADLCHYNASYKVESAFTKEEVELIISALKESCKEQEEQINSPEEDLTGFMDFLEGEVIDICYHNDEQGKEYLIKQYLKSLKVKCDDCGWEWDGKTCCPKCKLQQ